MTVGFPLPASPESEVGGLSVLFPPVYEIFWSVVIMLPLWLILGWALTKIYRMIDARREQIDLGLDAASKAEEEAALAKREREDLMRAAIEEAREIRDQANADATRIVAQARTEANEESIRITENTKRQIDAERRAAEVSLRKDVGTLATELAERIVGEHLKDEALSARVIDRFLDELEDDLKANTTKAGV